MSQGRRKHEGRIEQNVNRASPEETSLSPRRIASAIIRASREESFETAVNSACHLVYDHWFSRHNDVKKIIAQNYPVKDAFADSLRTLSQSAQFRMNEVVKKYLSGSDRERHQDVFEELIALRNQRLGGAGLQHGSVPLSSEFLAALVGSGETLLDPACGLGGSLLAAAKAHPRLEVRGIEIDPEVASIARERLALAEVDADIRSGDWFTEETNHWDCIVCEPPSGSRNASTVTGLREFVSGGEMVWAEKTAGSLKPAGIGAVLLPLNTTTRRGEVGRIRKRLLERGKVQAIIQLPARSILQSNGPACVWVFRGESELEKVGQVLMVDLSATLRENDANWEQTYAAVQACREWIDGASTLKLPNWVGTTVAVEMLLQKENCLPANYVTRHEQDDDILVNPGNATENHHHLLTELRLDNFKSAGRPVNIPLRPLTLIYGRNSAGKSSILQSLLLMKQSIDLDALNPYGPDTKLGSYASLVHDHDINRDLHWGLTFAPTSKSGEEHGSHALSRLRAIDIDFSWDSEKETAVPNIVSGIYEGRQVTWLLKSDEKETFNLSVDQLGYLAKTEEIEREQQGAINEKSIYRRLWSTLEEANFKVLEFEKRGLLPSRIAESDLLVLQDRGESSPVWTSSSVSLLRRTGTMVEAVSSELQDILSDIVYLGPLREAPTRLSQRSASTDELDIPFYLLHNLSQRQLVSQHLQELGMNYRLDAVPVVTPSGDSFVGELAGLVLTDIRTGVRLSPQDVGFGISQVLPIIVELSSRHDSVIMIEQPEIHLHPAMQAELTDLLIESVGPSGNANQVIAETHSENLVLRLQRRIKEGVIDNDDVAILYVDQDTEGNCVVKQLRLDENGGFIDEWPGGFFDEQFDELFGDFQ